MGGKGVGLALLLVGSIGCQACDNSCDYLPPVVDGPYTLSGGRAGSAFAAADYHGPHHDGPLPDPAAGEAESE